VPMSCELAVGHLLADVVCVACVIEEVGVGIEGDEGRLWPRMRLTWRCRV